jgi:response regulator RpfG family c-di-GMP phosphodiesterase
MEIGLEKYLHFKEYHHKSSSIPQALFDLDLRVVWYNDAFALLFRREENCDQLHIAELAELKGVDGRSLFHQLSDPATGYSFRGRGETRFQHHSSLYTNVLIMPMLNEENPDAGVGAYCAYFHDVSTEWRENLRGIFSGLLQASMMKDNDTGQHIERVNRYSKLIAQHLYEVGTDLEVTHDFVENISFLAAMHDVGKIGVPDDILNKQGSLEDWEWEIMKTHTVNGAYILSSYPDPIAVEIARSHHERWDGSGYPYGLTGNMIPMSARIVTIADVYDALRSRRSYKDAMGHDQSKELIYLGKETQFDPELIDCFYDLEKRFEEVYDEMEDIIPPGSRSLREL